MNNFGKNKKNQYDALRAGPIVQASLNISQDNLFTDICSPENLLQRFGRCNRFGNPIIGNFTILKPTSKKNNSIMAYLSKVEFSTNISFAFLSLIEKKLSGKEYTRQELADLYYEFHDTNQELYAEDFFKVESEAFSILTTTNGFEPVKFLNKKTKEFKDYVLSGGFRGSSIYILPLKAEYKDNKVCPINDYLWDINDININPNVLITADPDSSDIKQLITDFSSACKHIDKKKYNKYNNSFLQLTYRAKSPDSPIYVNYSLTDQKKANISIKDEYLYYIPYDENKISLGLISKEFMDKNNNK
jgi:CRISPR-associated endonuclease/helicase Cas3